MLGDDVHLLERWSSGDREAGTTLFERHFDSVHRFFSHKAGPDAADLTQRTFLACLEAAPRFRGDSSFRTFLFSIARHELFAYWRKRRREPGLDVAGSSIRDLDPTPSTWARRQNGAAMVLEALHELPLDLQIALEMFYLEHMTAPEVAQVLGVPEGTVRSRVRRALEELRAALSAHGVDGRLDIGAPALDGWADVVRASREAVDGP